MLGARVRTQVTILARECGLQLELSDIPIESLVPEVGAPSAADGCIPSRKLFLL